MSELINNSQKRRELLKHMILQLHKGEAPDMVRTRLVSLLKEIPYDEVVEVEQELIDEGLPAEEVLKFCDIHTMALDGIIDHSGAKQIPQGHPVDTFIMENRELLNVINNIELLFPQAIKLTDDQLVPYLMQMRAMFNSLMDVDKHYKRKEYLLFPYLESYGITGPPKVMWGKHDETRVLLKSAIASLASDVLPAIAALPEIIENTLLPAMKAISDMTLKEEEIMFPMTMDKLSDSDWYNIYTQTMEFGYCLYDPQIDWNPEGIDNEQLTSAPGLIQFPSGNFNLEELEIILNTMPIDVTFVDKDDKVRFFSMGEHRIFPRSRAIIGRDVRMCHPPSSVDVVEKILDDFKSGKESRAPFWINMHGTFIYIEYFALRDKAGNYMGTLEYSQDLTHLRALEGEQRLLSYSKND